MIQLRYALVSGPGAVKYCGLPRHKASWDWPAGPRFLNDRSGDPRVLEEAEGRRPEPRGYYEAGRRSGWTRSAQSDHAVRSTLHSSDQNSRNAERSDHCDPVRGCPPGNAGAGRRQRILSRVAGHRDGTTPPCPVLVLLRPCALGEDNELAGTWTVERGVPASGGRGAASWTRSFGHRAPRARSTPTPRRAGMTRVEPGDRGLKPVLLRLARTREETFQSFQANSPTAPTASGPGNPATGASCGR